MADTSIAENYIKEMNALRTEFNTFIPARKTPPVDLVDRICAATMAYADTPVSRCFVEELRNTTKGIWDFSKTRSMIDKTKSTLIVGVFENPYNSKMGLDVIICRQHDVDKQIYEKHPGQFARVIELLAYTDGLELNSCVALFGEHYVTRNGVEPENTACYFVDRFKARYDAITRKIMTDCLTAQSVPLARTATAMDVMGACCVWLHLHEYSHRLGAMPLPEFLDFKTPRDAAALEELRVDVQTILFCLELAEEGHPLSERFAEIIFAERCFRYAVQYDVTENFDARGSAILFAYLVKHGVITPVGQTQLSVDGAGLKTALQNIIDELATLEQEHCTSTRDEHTAAKRKMVRDLLHWDAKAKRYDLPPLMKRVEASLQSVNLSFEYAAE